MAPKTVTNLLLDLQVILRQAVRWRLIRSNPVSEAERPRVEQPEMQVLTEAEIAALGAAYEELEREAPESQKAWWKLAASARSASSRSERRAANRASRLARASSFCASAACLRRTALVLRETS